MKISFIIPDLSSETYHRTKSLHNMLKNDYELELISVDPKNNKTKLFAENFDNYKKVKYDLGTIIRDLKKNVTGDIIYAIKARPTSFGFAMSLKSIKKIPVVLDISANETTNCFPYTDSTLKGLLSTFFLVKDTNSYTYTKILEKRIKLADEITVASSNLQSKYGGTLISTSPDENLFNAELYKIKEIRESMNWTDKKVILFAGQYNRDTDFDLLLETVENISDQQIILYVVGDNKKVKESEKIKYLGFQPQQNIAKLLSACDMVVVPQKEIPSSFGKIPLKAYEAVLSNKPLILPDIYNFKDIFPSSIFYQVSNQESLTTAILKALDNNLPLNNRSDYIEKYSFEKMSKKLSDFFRKFDLP